MNLWMIFCDFYTFDSSDKNFNHIGQQMWTKSQLIFGWDKFLLENPSILTDHGRKGTIG